MTKNNPTKSYVKLATVVGVAALIVSLISQKFLPPEIPLFYGLAQGEDQLSPKLGLLIPGALSLVITLLNEVASKSLEDDYLIKALAIASLFASIFAITTTVRIILLTGSIF